MHKVQDMQDTVGHSDTIVSAEKSENALSTMHYEFALVKGAIKKQHSSVVDMCGWKYIWVSKPICPMSGPEVWANIQPIQSIEPVHQVR